MALIVNTFKANLNPIEFTLPFVDYPSWEESTSAKAQKFPGQITCRYALKDQPRGTGPDKARMVFLGDTPPSDLPTEVFDVSFQWRIGTLLIEIALEEHFRQRGFRIERTRFQVFALRPVTDSGSSAVELATGISFDAKHPFKDEPNDFAVTFNWEVRAQFRASLAEKTMAQAAIGMPVLYRPRGQVTGKLAPFENRYLGKVRDIDRGYAVVICRDDSEPQKVPLADLRLEATPAVIKQFEQSSQSRLGPSPVLRRIQQLKHSYTAENRRNVNAFRDRLEEIRSVLGVAGTSPNQIVLPLATSQEGSVSISTQPSEAAMGGLW
jgi:hypothetical protein